MGVFLGIGLAKVLSVAGMSTLITYSNVVGILILSIGIGMVSEILPAINASKLSPVDALKND